MADAQRQIAQSDDAAKIRRVVGEKIQELTGDGYVAVSMLDEPLQAIKVVGIYGFGDLDTDLVRLFNMDITSMAYPLKDMTDEELRLFRSGRLEKFEGGLYHILVRKVPQAICDAAERQLAISGVYTMALSRKGFTMAVSSCWPKVISRRIKT